VRTYGAPVAEDASINWAEALIIDSNELDLRAVPDENREFASRLAPEVLTQSVSRAEEAFRQFVVDTEKLRIFQNSAFGIYSQPHESRDAFVARCLEEATHRLEEEAERLESTFRRRLDQVKERSERDTRQLDAEQESSPRDEHRQDVNVAWGQALYNITSGKPAAVAETSHSVREGDYLEKIAQIQRSWDKELESLRDDLTGKARSVEEISVSPSAKSIDVTRYLIVWAPRLQ
jgi:hypothetical protein